MKRSAILCLGFVCLALVCLYRQVPGAGHAGGTYSDGAIPQLMANADAWTAYHLYYWGQDRLGGWPYSIAWLIRQVTHLGWTIDRLHWLLGLILLSGAWPLYRLGREWGAVLAAGFLAALCLVPEARHHFNVALPYGCQISMLLWTWWVLRQAREELAQSRRRLVLAAVFAFLSIWSSPVSAFLLVPVVLAELIELRGGPVPLSQRGWLFAPIVAGVVGELVIRFIHAGAEIRSEAPQQLAVSIDWDHLRENVRACVANIRGSSLGLLVPGALLLNVGLLVRRPARETGRQLLALASTLFALWVISLSFPACLDWVRLNGYQLRYFGLTHLLGAMAAGTTLLVVVDALLPERRSAIVASLAGVLAVAAAIPHTTPSEELRRLSRVSEALAQRAPGAVLFGGYWGTYVLVDGSAAQPLLPVVSERNVDRVPWARGHLKMTPTVLVSHYEEPRFGPGAAPFPYIYEYGTLLALETPDWLADGPIHISRYRNVTSEAADDVTMETERATVANPCRVEACVPIGPREPGQEALSVSFPPTRRGRLVVFFGPVYDSTAHIPAFTLVPVNASKVAPEIHITTQGPTVVVDFASAEPVSGWRLLLDSNAGAQDVPNARAAFLLPAAAPSTASTGH